jgi:hypothetical protein
MRVYTSLGLTLTAPDGTQYQSGLPYIEFQYPVAADGSNVQWHKVKNSEAGRLDLIAWIWFSDCSYWRVIALANNIDDPLTEVVTDMDLAIPTDPITINNLIGFVYGGT